MFSTFYGKLLYNVNFRVKLFLFLSLFFNFAYALFLFVVSIIYFSQWFLVMSIYYALLTITRLFVFFETNHKKDLRKKILTMRACGLFLVLLNVVVSIMMIILIYTPQTIKYHEIIVIALATHTFTALTLAIIQSIKHLKKNHYTYLCIKIINLVCASVSLTTLTSTMLATFGNDNTLLRSIILPLLSCIVSIFIVACAILMIKKANYDLRVLKNEQK